MKKRKILKLRISSHAKDRFRERLGILESDIEAFIQNNCKSAAYYRVSKGEGIIVGSLFPMYITRDKSGLWILTTVLNSFPIRTGSGKPESFSAEIKVII